MISNKELFEMLDGVEFCDINSGRRYCAVGVYGENGGTVVSLEEAQHEH